MKVLITGATGFIGKHLSSYLESKGHIVLSVGQTTLPESTKDCIAYFEREKPDAVIHLASCFIAEHKPEDIGNLADSNFKYGLKILEAMARTGIKNFINTGTSWQHFQTEKNEYRPVCLYAATKQAFEAVTRYYADAEKFKVIHLKLFDTYGPNDARSKLVPTLLKYANTAGGGLKLSPGAQLVDFVHINDVVRAYETALNRIESLLPCTEETYAISSGKRLSLKDFIGEFEKASGKKLAVEFGAREYREREVMKPWSDGGVLPGWNAQVDLQSGLKSLFQEDS